METMIASAILDLVISLAKVDNAKSLNSQQVTEAAAPLIAQCLPSLEECNRRGNELAKNLKSCTLITNYYYYCQSHMTPTNRDAAHELHVSNRCYYKNPINRTCSYVYDRLEQKKLEAVKAAMQ